MDLPYGFYALVFLAIMTYTKTYTQTRVAPAFEVPTSTHIGWHICLQNLNALNATQSILIRNRLIIRFRNTHTVRILELKAKRSTTSTLLFLCKFRIMFENDWMHIKKWNSRMLTKASLVCLFLALLLDASIQYSSMRRMAILEQKTDSTQMYESFQISNK